MAGPTFTIGDKKYTLTNRGAFVIGVGVVASIAFPVASKAVGKTIFSVVIGNTAIEVAEGITGERVFKKITGFGSEVITEPLIDFFIDTVAVEKKITADYAELVETAANGGGYQFPGERRDP